MPNIDSTVAYLQSQITALSHRCFTDKNNSLNNVPALTQHLENILMLLKLLYRNYIPRMKIVK